MTGPYFAFASSSALTATGQTKRSARTATKKRVSEDARRRDCVRDGRRVNRDIAVRVVVNVVEDEGKEKSCVGGKCERHDL